MKTDLFRITFLSAMAISILAALVRITHVMNAAIFVYGSLFLTLAFIVVGIIEVHQSSRSFTSKLLWSFGLIFFNFFTAILYLINRRGHRIIKI